MEYYIAMKNEEVLHATTWMNFTDIMINRQNRVMVTEIKMLVTFPGILIERNHEGGCWGW